MVSVIAVKIQFSSLRAQGRGERAKGQREGTLSARNKQDCMHSVGVLHEENVARSFSSLTLMEFFDQ